jgi:sugar O-acyltransferase (sialic acid O-acetyltransferase NeuD family)
MMIKRIVLIGGGPHVQYCIDIIEKAGIYEIVGITDPYPEIGTYLYGYKIIGRQEQIKDLINEYNIEGGLITIGDNWVRKQVYEFIMSYVPEFNFINAIHPSAIIGKNVRLGFGITIMAGCIISPGCTIGNFTFFATGAQLDHDSEIGDFGSISAGSITGGFVKIGMYSALTLGVTVIDHLDIGENSVIGAGSVVLKDIPNNVLVYGNPARIIRSRFPGERFLKPGSIR